MLEMFAGLEKALERTIDRLTGRRSVFIGLGTRRKGRSGSCVSLATLIIGPRGGVEEGVSELCTSLTGTARIGFLLR
jgi:hypothetical protein